VYVRQPYHVEGVGRTRWRSIEATLPTLSSAEANASRASHRNTQSTLPDDRLSNHTEDFAYDAELCYYERFVKSVHLLARTPHATCNEV
jgi:hypothetical protein